MPDIILDDRDSSINYVGQWVQGGLQGSEYQATTMHCIAPASGTSATLRFVGTGVAVYGTVIGNDIQASSYKVDDSDPINFKSNNNSAMRFLQQFFSIPEGNLSNNSHTLVITPVKGTLSLDFMTVHILSLSSNALSPPPPHNNNIGLIVGAVVGALGLICAVVTVVVCLRRQRPIRRQKSNIFSDAVETPTRGVELQVGQRHSTVSPYDLASSNSQASQLMPVSMGGTYTYSTVDGSATTSTEGGYPSERLPMRKARDVLRAPPEYTSGVATS